MTLITIPSQAHPKKFGWLVPGFNCTQLAMDVLLRADCDNGILEVPNGSNRGTRLDDMVRRAGLPVSKDPRKEGPYWCAVWCGIVAADVGLKVPKNFPGTDYWLPYVKPGRDKAKPEPGDFIIYGLKKSGPVVGWGDAHHIGIVARVPEPEKGQMLLLTIEGNRSYAGTTSNNGVAVDMGASVRKDILGYVSPETLRG